jgi:2-aminoadipate transaminase
LPVRYSRRLKSLRPSTIREILKVTTQPDVISFAGGLPAPELFPVADVLAAAERVLSGPGAASALQYGETEGYRPLREWVAGEMARRGAPCLADEVLITSGSQQALDLFGRVFLDPGDVVLTENPTYLAAIQAFQAYECEFVPVPTDEDGIVPAALPGLIARHHPKFLYIIPNFQNPTGVTLVQRRRSQLAQIAAEQGLVVVEDDPYRQLRYTGEHLAPVKAGDQNGRVLYTSTFSKTIAPGLRLGWLVAPREILAKLVVAKQAADLHSSSLDQRIVWEYLSTGENDGHVQCIRAAYHERYLAMDAALRAHLPPGFHWTPPEGGMFLWVTCPESLDTSELLAPALQRKVLFVPGRDFFPDGRSRGHNYMRLNFSNSTPERISEGVRRLAGLLEEALARKRS